MAWNPISTLGSMTSNLKNILEIIIIQTQVIVSDVLGLGLGSGPQARQAQPKKSPAQPGPVVGPMRAQGWA